MHKVQLVLSVCCSIPVDVGQKQFLSVELHWNFLHHQTCQSEHDLQCDPMADIHNYHAWSSKYPGYFKVSNIVTVAANILWNNGPKFCYIYAWKILKLIARFQSWEWLSSKTYASKRVTSSLKNSIHASDSQKLLWKINSTPESCD